MTNSRLPLPGPTRFRCRILIILWTAQDVECRFGQVARHRTHGLAVPLALPQPPL
jgi:hypothetical protein